jgi:hypothetical protein
MDMTLSQDIAVSRFIYQIILTYVAGRVEPCGTRA